MLSCAQEEEVSSVQEKSNASSVLPVAQAQLEFAQLLSKAAYNSLEVRSFLRKEALKQFDNDYDIFYPLVRNKVVSGDQTFRDVLLSYSKDENELSQIEHSLPLLNILVPDLSLFGDFNAKNWDVNSNDVAVICRDDDSNTLYENGENTGSLQGEDVPDFPCLVVKNNERLEVSNVNTRSGEATYKFRSDAFDGTKKKVQTRSERDDDLEPTENLGAGINASEFKADIVAAWNEFKDVPNAYQRDYLYYGITKANKPGPLNRNIREELYRFRIQADAFSTIADQEDKDPQLQEISQRKRELSNDEIVKRIWKDGNFEFHFKSYIAAENGKEAMEHMITASVKASDLFSISKVHVYHKNRTGFRHSRNVYSVDVKNLKSKWLYLRKHSGDDENSVFLLPWDLYTKSIVIHLFVEEFDDGQTIEESKTVVDQFTNKLDFSAEGGGDIDKVKMTMKLGYGFSHVNTSTSSMKRTTSVGSDQLGTLSFFYYDPIIKNRNSDGTYNLYSVNNGTVEATILPRDARR